MSMASRGDEDEVEVGIGGRRRLLTRISSTRSGDLDGEASMTVDASCGGRGEVKRRWLTRGWKRARKMNSAASQFFYFFNVLCFSFLSFPFLSLFSVLFFLFLFSFILISLLFFKTKNKNWKEEKPRSRVLKFCGSFGGGQGLWKVEEKRRI